MAALSQVKSYLIAILGQFDAIEDGLVSLGAERPTYDYVGNGIGRLCRRTMERAIDLDNAARVLAGDDSDGGTVGQGMEIGGYLRRILPRLASLDETIQALGGDGPSLADNDGRGLQRVLRRILLTAIALAAALLTTGGAELREDGGFELREDDGKELRG